MVAKIKAVIKAIIEPLPVSISAEKYRPKMTELSPNICVQIKQDLKLLPINFAVAAGVTNKAVTKGVPTICTMLTTTAAVITLNRRPMFLTGRP